MKWFSVKDQQPNRNDGPKTVTKKEYLETYGIVIHPSSEKPSIPGLYMCLGRHSIVALLFFNGERWEYSQQDDKFDVNNFHWIRKDSIT